MLFGNSSTLHAGSMYENGDCEYISLTFDPKLVYGYDHSILYTKYVKHIIQNASLPAILFDGSAHWHNDIRSIIEANYAFSLTLADISESIHVCPSECSRLFKKYMQISLFDFIARYRIEKSVEYLTSTNFSIVEIAGFVGFNDSNYYAKVFRRQKGCSPTQYRCSSQNKD